MSLHRPALALPVNAGPGYCPTCWTPPGKEHELSCPEVTPEHALAFIQQGTRRPLPFPDATRVFAGLLIGLPIGAALWLICALIAWSLA